MKEEDDEYGNVYVETAGRKIEILAEDEERYCAFNNINECSLPTGKCYRNVYSATVTKINECFDTKHRVSECYSWKMKMLVLFL